MTDVGGPWDCVHDATHLRGLSALMDAHPARWPHEMHAASRRVGLGTTVAEALRAGGQGLLLPYGASEADARRLKAPRRAARLLLQWYGHVRLADITERWLVRERRRQAHEADVSGDQVSRCFSLLRKVALRAARHDRVAPLVRPRVPSRNRAAMGPPPERPIPAGSTVEALMHDGKDRRVRAAVALQALVGATSARVLALRVRDVRFRQAVVSVPIPGPHDQFVRETYVLTPDAREAILPWLLKRRRFGPDALLFPMRGDPSRPTKSINRAIRRVCLRLGVPPVTLQAVRRRAQKNLREAGGTRAQVRGSRRVRPASRPASPALLPHQHKALLRSAESGHGRLPRRAPRDRGADEPELGPRQQPQDVWPTGARNLPVRAPGTASRPVAELTGDDPSAAMEAEIRDRMWNTTLPKDRAAVLPPVASVPAQVVQHTTVHVHGATPAQVEALVQQALALGVSLTELVRRMGSQSE